MKRDWITPPPRKPDTWIDPTADLPRFLKRRLDNQRKQVTEGTITYRHPYTSFLEDMVLWARNEHNAEFHYFADRGNQRMVGLLREYGPQYILAQHPDFASMIEIVTPDTWGRMSRRLQDHLIAGYKVAQELGIVRRQIEMESAIRMLIEASPNPPTKEETVTGLISFFTKRGAR